MATNPLGRPTLPATIAGPRPDDFPLGSIEQRAAARAELDRRRAAEDEVVMTVTFSVVGGGGPVKTLTFTRSQWPTGLPMPGDDPSP
jgi:hypothetical protein